MKVEKCPQCGSLDLGDKWCSGRKLQQFCHEADCDWDGPVRIPEKIRITNTKRLRIDGFPGFNFTIYDQYGHITTLSQTFGTEAAARNEMERVLHCGETKNNPAGPYTGVLFKTPSCVILKGKMFKIKNGKCGRTK